MSALLIAVPVLSLLAAAGVLAFGRRLPWGGGELVFAAIAMSLLALIPLADGTHLSATWFTTGGYRLTVGLQITKLTWVVGVIVAGTAIGVGLYSLGYMAGKPDRPRFFAELGLFVGAMLTLVLADSLVLLFAAWEMVGVASYLLIGFRYDEPGAPAAAAKAFLMTRIGDMGLLLGWLLALAATGTTDIATLVSAAGSGQLAVGSVTLMAFLILAGAIGKSAQLPLTGWLPDAMIAPTPVSALLHSATMVAAGAFLIMRLYPLFQAAPAALAALFWIGAATALVGGLVATAETDLKRVLAWSTSSQLGEMMIALGLGGPLAASLHLAAHAAFKSTLFLAAGAVQEQAGTRDLRQLGGLIRLLPVTGAVFVIAALALAGVPPLSGFWSEEAILAIAARQEPAPAVFILLLVLLGGLYVGRVATATFFGERRTTSQIREPDWTMRIGMVLLAIPAAVLGWIFSRRLGTSGPETTWRLLGIATGILGLSVGGTRAWRGAPPVLGSWPATVGAGLMEMTMAPARWTMRLAAKLDAVERALDRAARAIANAADGLAGSIRAVEYELDQTVEWTGAGAWRLAGAAEDADHRLDMAAERLADGTWCLARVTEGAEALGFGRGGDRMASNIGIGGERLRTLQTGKLYLYTLGLFLWAVAALAVGGLMLWL